MNAVTWMLRGLLGIGGVVLVYVAWPVAGGAWQAQKADAVLFELRTQKPMELASVQAAVAALDRAVARRLEAWATVRAGRFSRTGDRHG